MINSTSLGNSSRINFWSGGHGFNRHTPINSRTNNPIGNNMANTSPDFRASLLNVRRSADLLASSLNFMQGIGSVNASSPFRSQRATPENANILEMRDATAARLVTSGVNQQDFSVEVLQLATAQRNEGTALQAGALATTAGFSTGSHRLSIQVGDSQFDFNFSVSATDTVRDVQQRIATAINTRVGQTGVTASVNVDNATGTSALVLASAETGVAREGQPNFTVRSATGNAASVAGIDTITQAAQNAQFRVNRGFTGGLRTSRSNDVDLGFSMTATLRSVGTTEVSMNRDQTGQINAFRHMVNAVNDLVDAVGSNPRFQREMASVLRGASLRQLGITVNRNGRMQIDDARMQRAAENGALQRFVEGSQAGSPHGFMNRLTRVANSVSQNPGNFVTAPDHPNADPWANFGNNMDFFAMAGRNNFSNMGMLFDSMF